MNRRTSALPVSAVLLLALLTACGQGTGSRPYQASASLGPATPARTETAATPPATVPGTTPAPTDVAGAFIRSADQAIAAVVSLHPEYAGYEPFIPDPGRSADGSPRPVFGGRPDIGGATKTVTVSGPDDAGWHVTFVTGSGDCPAGCIDHRSDRFLVTRTGVVTLECTTDRPPSMPAHQPCSDS